MKFLILLLISFTAQASYIPESLVGQDTTGRKIYSNQNKCQDEESEQCISIKDSGNNPYDEVVAQTQMKEDVESCVDEADCQAILASKSCSTMQASPIYTLAPNEVYCTWLRPRQVMANAAAKAAHDALKAQKEAVEAVIESQLSDMSLGKRLIAMVNASSRAKGLNKAQKKSLRASLKDIKDDLEAGHICEAKVDIDALSADGTLILQSDLDGVKGYLNANKTCP